MRRRNGTVALPDYGIDAPVVIRNLVLVGVVCLVAGVVAVAAGVAVGIGLLVAAASLLVGPALMLRSSRVGKLRERDRLLDEVAWRGDEQALDVGCGRGLLLVGAARRAPDGSAVGLDLWRSADLTGNTAAATYANAAAEGVAARVEVVDGDAREMPFADASFDVVLSCFALHNIAGRDGRAAAIAEIARVLRPGGQVGIIDFRATRLYADELARHGLGEVGRSGLRFNFYPPARVVRAVKSRDARGTSPL